MKEKNYKQKGFTQIPLLVIIVASIVVASVGAGVVLHQQGKLAPLVANISQVFKETEETTIIEKEIKSEEPQTEQEDTSQLEQELEYSRLETEIAKAKAEKLIAEQKAQELEQELTQEEQQKEEARKQEIERQLQEALTKIRKEGLLDLVDIQIDGFEYLEDYLENTISIIDQRISGLNSLKNSVDVGVAKFPEIEDFQILSEGIGLAIQGTQIERKNLSVIKNSIRRMINSFSETKNVISAQSVIPKTGVDNFNDWVSFINDDWGEIFDDYWNDIDDGIQDYKEEMKSSGYILDIAFEKVLSRYSYSVYQYIPSPNYQSYYTYPIQNWLSNTYKEQQIDALRNINETLEKIIK